MKHLLFLLASAFCINAAQAAVVCTNATYGTKAFVTTDSKLNLNMTFDHPAYPQKVSAKFYDWKNNKAYYYSKGALVAVVERSLFESNKGTVWYYLPRKTKGGFLYMRRTFVCNG